MEEATCCQCTAEALFYCDGVDCERYCGEHVGAHILSQGSHRPRLLQKFRYEKYQKMIETIVLMLRNPFELKIKTVLK